MESNYPSHMLEVSVAQMCLAVGWSKTKPSALTYLAALLERYLRKIGQLCMGSAELNNRTAANLDDLAFVFAYLRIDMEQLEEYCRDVTPTPLPYPVPNSGHLSRLPSFSVSRNELKRKRPSAAGNGE
ncbi:transcription initiation factor TFIID subunit 3-like [Anopheles arabiensis]|uniref:transcription initiation factor TFIID subunit 3-like n=1 Tax=Anopheles arabiensis TaxID=7173 RepID=UPI001AADDA2B|nr:transcription initiation factor TFIID subunit 3-like [Anopheles arabiensis]